MNRGAFPPQSLLFSSGYRARFFGPGYGLGSLVSIPDSATFSMATVALSGIEVLLRAQ